MQGVDVLQFLLVHIAVALAAPALMRKLGRKGFVVLALLPLSVAIWALTQTSAVLAGHYPEVSLEWIPALGMVLDFRLDTLSWLLTMLVGGVGALVLFYCGWYFSTGAKYLGRFAAVFMAFAGAMLGLVLTDNTLVMFVFWELTTVFSYLLIGHYYERKGSRRAAMQAIIVTTFGGLAMLGGIVMLGSLPGGSYSFSELVANPVQHDLLWVALLLVLTGAVTKSALVPFHFWLPGAMAAPTPVSAYLHAAAMVKAGVYLVARLAPGYADQPIWKWMILILGGTTMIVGGYRALRQNDLKLVLAFGTVSQLGFLILLVGQADRFVALAGLALVGAHAMFKAALFLTVGVIDAATGTRDLRELSGLGKSLRWAAIPGILATASMVGLPPTAGYVGKEAVLAGLNYSGTPHDIAVMVIVVIGSVLTFAYGARFCWGAFATKKGVKPSKVDRESRWLFVPPNLLAAAGIVAGSMPWLGERLLSPHANTYPQGEHEGYLTLWAGVNLPFILTICIIVAGVALFVNRAVVEKIQAKGAAPTSADQIYHKAMRKLDQIATTVTSRTQRGSLPLYLGIIMMTTVAGVTIALVSGGLVPTTFRLWDNPVQAVVALIIIVAAFLTARSRRRLKAVILLGVVGYGMVVLFEIQGAPDLALTQALVETVTLVVFILVLRRLPPYFSDRPWASDRWWRIVVAVASALMVMWLALVIPLARIHEPVSNYFLTEAYEYGYGQNIVNVTLVDIRAWDTMGEISVLLAAATGVASLLFIRTRSRDIDRVREAPDSPVWSQGLDPGSRGALQSLQYSLVDPNKLKKRIQNLLPATGTLAPQRRSVIMEMATRVLFHTMLVFALYLLFAGHNQPGGGFAAGIVAGIALVVRYLAGGRYELGEAAPVQAGTLLGSGLFLAVGAGLAPLLFGGTILQSFMVEFAVPILGDVKIVSTILFDIGVFLVVVGLILDILRSLGAEVDRQAESEGESAPDIPHDSPRKLAQDSVIGGDER